MKLVFVDSSAFFALLSPVDLHHRAAFEQFRRARNEHWDLITTNLVVAEAHALILNRLKNGPTLGLKFLEGFERGVCRIERVSRSDERRAMVMLRGTGGRQFTMCDATSFAVMTRLHLRRAIAFDRHFSGYSRLP